MFVAICATGSFTRAADHLAITKSAASQHVATLERELGVQLLHRSTRSLALTETGTALLVEARALLEQARGLAERTRRRAAQLTGVLRLTSADDTAGWVAPLIAEYVRLHPGMEVEYRPSDRLLDLVAEGMDLSLRTTGRRDSSLRAVNLAEFDIWCVASPQYLREHGTPRRLGDLASHAWIAFTQIPRPWTLQTRAGKPAVRLKRRLSTSSTAGGRPFCARGGEQRRRSECAHDSLFRLRGCVAARLHGKHALQYAERLKSPRSISLVRFTTLVVQLREV